MRATTLALALAALAAGVGSALPAQELADRVERTRGDVIRFAFPARPGVCGAGDALVIRDADGSTSIVSGHFTGSEWRRWREGEPPCEIGDVLVALRRGGGGIEDVDLRIGAPTEAGLGLFAGQEAADFLLDRAAAAPERVARRMIMAATLADDAVVWPELLRLAKDRSLASGTRRSALHWLGRAAADEAVRELGGIVRDRTESDEIREAAVFGLSQLSDDQGVPLLIEIARTTDDPRVRRSALFWLAESEDERALALFEEILSGG